MKRILLQLTICLAALVVWSSTKAQTEPQWLTSKNEALSAAISQNKKVLLLYGRNTCMNCNSVKQSIAGNAVRPIVDRGYVLWFSNCDDRNSVTESMPIISKAFGSGSVTLPVLAALDPKDPTKPLELTTGYKNATALKEMLGKYVPAEEQPSGEAWITSKSEAFSRAKAEGKLIFMLYGRSSCTNCNAAKGFCAGERIKPVLDKNFICWYVNCDDNKAAAEAVDYTAKAYAAGSPILPILSTINPNYPKKVLTTSANYRTEDQISMMLSGAMQMKVPAPEVNSSDLFWCEAHKDAVEAALKEKKKIFLMWGRLTCGNCNAVKAMLNQGELKKILKDNYVLWYNDSDVNFGGGFQYFSHITGGAVYMPALAVVDLALGDTSESATMGFRNADQLMAMLQEGLKTKPFRSLAKPNDRNEDMLEYNYNEQKNTAEVFVKKGNLINGHVEIPEKVTKGGKEYVVDMIRYDGFMDQVFMTSIKMPNTIYRIWSGAFYNCYSLQNVVLPQNENLHINPAFKFCYKLKSIKLPDKMKAFGNIFDNCGLTELNIPKSVNRIYDYGIKEFEAVNLVTVNWEVPFEFSEGALKRFVPENQKNKTLRVPKGTKEAYQKHIFWKTFGTIEEFDPNDTTPEVTPNNSVTESIYPILKW